jgi:DNA polymerase III epsilon subunit-like protein
VTPESAINTDLVFVDTECTGLRPDDEIWEFAGLRRFTDGSTSWLHMLVEHDEMRAATGLPEPFRSQYLARRGSPENRWSRKRAAIAIAEFLGGDAVMVGAVPTFDSLHLTKMLHRYGILAPHRYAVLDVEALAAGYLTGTGHTVCVPPNGEQLSRELGIDPGRYERHTAVGDVKSVSDLYERIMG